MAPKTFIQILIATSIHFILVRPLWDRPGYSKGLAVKCPTPPPPAVPAGAGTVSGLLPDGLELAERGNGRVGAGAGARLQSRYFR